MSQSHLVIDFPIRGPANAKALPDELPALMPDLAKAQDDLGTVHFSRFMVEGDEKLLFLSDIDGEVDEHIERLVESAGPVFDAIFTHVADPPATPVADNPERVVKWLKRHVREPLDTYFAYGDASVQDIKACARAAGFTGNTSQSTLLTYMAFKSRLQAFAVKLVAGALIGDKGHKASDSIGTLHFAHFVPFENNHIGFFTVYDGDMEKYFQDFADKTSYVFDALFPHVDWRAADPGRKERPGVLSVGSGQQLSGDRVLQRLSGPLGSRHPSPAGRLPQVTSRPPPDSAGVTWSRTMINPEFGVGRGVQLTRSTGDEGPGASSPVAWSSAA